MSERMKIHLEALSSVMAATAILVTAGLSAEWFRDMQITACIIGAYLLVLVAIAVRWYLVLKHYEK